MARCCEVLVEFQIVLTLSWHGLLIALEIALTLVIFRRLHSLTRFVVFALVVVVVLALAYLARVASIIDS